MHLIGGYPPHVPSSILTGLESSIACSLINIGLGAMFWNSLGTTTVKAFAIEASNQNLGREHRYAQFSRYTTSCNVMWREGNYSLALRSEIKPYRHCLELSVQQTTMRPNT
ncbi:hypothetical protein TNCV_2786321 [Trichonephila clavipes]|nr:hypothetical protein TNCV_2786321 [Trichonephila clavipes]